MPNVLYASPPGGGSCLVKESPVLADDGGVDAVVAALHLEDDYAHQHRLRGAADHDRRDGPAGILDPRHARYEPNAGQR